jgi:CheY-like chemotaxis protein
MHGGALEALSEGEGLGATFTLRVPAAEFVEAALPAPRPFAPRKAARPLSIVVVEDDGDAASVLFEWLEDLGHRVTVAHTGAEGLRAIRERRPNLVICDIGLPDISGLEVCRSVRSLAGEAQPIMVALTGWGKDHDRRLSQESGFELHLVKPVATDELHRVLQSASESLSLRPEGAAGGAGGAPASPT